MTTSHTNGKQRDRVASYTGGLLSKANNGGPSSAQTNPKKKPYRARGCRGGASRKSRKKQSISNPSRQNEENDPSRLNANSEKHPYNTRASHEGQNHKSANNYNERDTKSINGGSDKSRLNAQAQSQNKTRTLSILPNGNVLSVHQGAGGHTSESNTTVGLIDQSQDNAKNSSGPKTILPSMASNSTVQTTSRAENNVLSAIARPNATSSAGRSNDRSGQIAVGGFSFFCISPRSFLSGQRRSSRKG